MTQPEQTHLLSLLRQCRPILRLSGVAMSAQAGHMVNTGVDSLEKLEGLREQVDAALAVHQDIVSAPGRDPLSDPMPGDVVRHTSINIVNGRMDIEDFVVVRRYVDPSRGPMVEWTASADKNPREAHVDAMTLEEWREGIWNGGVVRVAGVDA